MIRFDKHLLDRDKEYDLGFSGGADSLAALLFLRAGGWNIRPVHVSHFNNTRSRNIARGVSLLWEYLGVEGVIHTMDSDMEPTEANAYKIRNYVWGNSDRPVILCNHLNDLAEGYFMNCMQGFPERVPLVAVNGNKIRPFLRTKKASFYTYLENRGLTHLIIPDDMLSLRGKLRETVFPTLQDDWTAPAKKLFVDTGRIYRKGSGAKNP